MKCSFLCPHHVSSRGSGFPVASPCLWGNLQKLSLSNVLTVKVGRSLARNFCFSAPCLLSSLWFSCGLALSRDKLQNISFLEVSKQVVLRGRCGTL